MDVDGITLDMADGADGSKAPLWVACEVVGTHLAQLAQQARGHGLLVADVAHLLEEAGKLVLTLVDAHELLELHSPRGV